MTKAGNDDATGTVDTVRILVVDDMQDNLDLICEVLEDAPYEIMTAPDAETALKLAHQKPPDLAILDVQMPGVSGYELCQRFRDSSLTQRMPVIFLTAQFTSRADAIHGLDLGACDYIFKPFNTEELRARVRAVLRVEAEHRNAEARLREYAADLELDTTDLKDSKQTLEGIVAKNRYLIAELQETYRRLHDSQATTHALLNAPPESAILIDRDGTVLACNAAATRRFCISDEELAGCCFYDLLLPDVAAEYRRYVDIVFRTGQQMPFQEKSGERVFEIYIYPICDRDRKITACAVFAYDITEHKRAEKATKELVRMKTELVANVSHELRTPICSLKGLLELLVKGRVADPAVQHEFLTRAIGDVHRLATLVDDLLDLSRLEAGRLELNLEQTDIGSLITETVQSLETLAAEKHVLLIYTPPVATLTVAGDRSRLQQVLVNLIGNAIKFSNAHRSIRITVNLENESVVVRVIDEGPGIPQDALPRLFRRFYRPDTPQKRRGQGTGLGLYISKQIIEAHGGEIGVESEPGVGSTFFFVLPTQGHGASPQSCGQHTTPLHVHGCQDGGSSRH